MATQYSQEQMQGIYEKLPQELKTALFSEETAEVIGNACTQYGIEDERVSQVAGLVGNVLTGFLLPSEFEDALKQNVKLPEVLIKPIAREISRFVFYPVKPALERLHRDGMSKETEQTLNIPTPRHDAQQDQQLPLEETEESRTISKEQKSREADPYRESIE
ncbi:hypothetical protein IIA94_01345 [Patescibacteria group bacterium]|nr:hypothetical protein [Patescibacteria group bacterium]